MPGVTWDADADRKLLLCIFGDAEVKINYQGAAAAMSTDDVVCTVQAVSTRMKRLRKLATDLNGGSGKEDADDAGPAAPKTKPAAKRGKKAVTNDGDDEGIESPKKKARKAPAKAKGSRSKAKAPVSEEEDADDDKGQQVKGEPDEDDVA